MFQKINIHKKLIKERKKAYDPETLLNNYKQILELSDIKRESILETLKKSDNNHINIFDIDKVDGSKIFHVSQVKNICADYRLRFLNSVHFIKEYPSEAISKIRELENTHNTKISGFKIVAPLKAFKLKKADDPLLFAPMGNDYYYLIHKWGDDLHPLRKLKCWSFKNIENLLISLTLISIVFTYFTYPFFISNEPSFGYLLMLFMFYFKGVVGMFFIFFGSSGKNFSEYSWQSQYDKIR